MSRREQSSPCWQCAHFGGQVGTWSNPEVLCLHGTGRRREKQPGRGCVYWFYPSRPEARVIVSGSTEFRDMERVAQALDKLLERKHLTGIIHGITPGAEMLADDWAGSRGIPITRCTLDRAMPTEQAVPVRNAKMLRLQPTGVVILATDRHSAADLITQARAANVPVWAPYLPKAH